MTQRVGKFIAGGHGFSDDVACDGKAHKVSVWVTPWNRSFTKGVAFAKADLGNCGEFGFGDECTMKSDSREIAIR